MNKEDEKQKIKTDPDYIYCPSSDNSIEKFLTKHPEGANDDKVAQVLLTTPDKVRKYYSEAVESIKKDMGLNDEQGQD